MPRAPLSDRARGTADAVGFSAKTAYFPALTSLRGIAALLVLVFHAPLFGFAPFFAGQTEFAVKGYLWVDFFFLLSGFVISHSHAADFAGRVGRQALGDYLVARLARIYPLHVTMLVVLLFAELLRALLLGDAFPVTPRLFLPQDFGWRSFLANLTLLQGVPIAARTSWNAPAWSISCEAVVYLAFPLVTVLLGSGRRRVFWLLAAVSCVSLVAIARGAQPHTLDSGCNIIRCAAEFSLGMCLYHLFSKARLPSLLGRDRFAAVLIAALALSLHLGLPDLAIVPQLGLLVLVGAANGGRLRALLGLRAPHHLGRISYSIYMVHFPAFYVAAILAQAAWGPGILHLGPIPRLFLLLAGIAAILPLAHLSFEFVELPCRRALLARWKRRGELAQALEEGAEIVLPPDGAPLS